MSLRWMTLVLLVSACDPTDGIPGDAGPPPLALLPADYPRDFVELRGCRASAEHFPHMRILLPGGLRDAYDKGPFPLPAGTIVVKEEFDDARCQSLTGYTLMKKESPGRDPANGDWRHQRLDDRRRVVLDGPAATRACTSCHARCQAELGRDFVCADP